MEEVKNKHIHVKVTETEKEKFEELAKKQGINVSQLIRNILYKNK